MAAQRKRVALLARNAEARRQPLRRQAHRKISVRIMIHQPGVRRNFVAAHGDHRHRFRPARHHHLGAAAHDALGRHGNRLQAGRAEPIDSHRRHLDRQPRAQRSNASHVHPLLGFGHGAAQDDVFNFLGIELRHAIKRALDRDGSQFIRTRSPQRAFERAAYGSADGRNYYDFTHRLILLRLAAAALRSAWTGETPVPTQALSRKCHRRSMGDRYLSSGF